MPTRAPSRTRAWWCLAAVLGLALGTAHRGTAKPPDLPLPVKYDFVPVTDPTLPLTPDTIVVEPHEPETNGALSMADQCAAARTITRCALFALNPLTWAVRTKHFCNFDEEAPYPVVCVGDEDYSVHSAVRDAAVALCSGPFGPFYLNGKAAVGEDFMPLHGGAIIEGLPNWGDEEPSKVPCNGPMGPTPRGDCCPHFHRCPDRKSYLTDGPCQQEWEKLSEVERARLVERCMVAGELCGAMGMVTEACAWYQRVCQLCPGTCYAMEAAERIRSLGERTASDCAASKPPKDAGEEKAEPVDSVEGSVLEKLDELDKAGRLYADAEVLMHEGRVDEACSLYEEVRRLVPGHRFAEMAADRLGDLEGLRSRPPAAAEQQESTADLSEVFQGTRRLLIAVVDGAIEPFVYTKKPTKKIEMLVNDADSKRRLEEEWARFWLEQSAEKPRLVRRHYHVGDLVSVTAPGKKKGKCTTSTPDKAVRRLIRIIERTIAPQSWDRNGGEGAIAYFPLGQTLVVSNDLVTQEQIADLLSTLRRNQRRAERAAAKKRSAAKAAPVGGEEDSSLAEQKSELCAAGYDVSALLALPEVEWDRKTDTLRLVVKEVGPEELIGLIQNGIVPNSWACYGGAGTIDYNPTLKTLFVSQTPEVHEAVRAFLDARQREVELRRRNCERDVEKGSKIELEIIPDR